MKDQEIKKGVRKAYAKVARQEASCCGSAEKPSCCGDAHAVEAACQAMGYGIEELKSVPESANLGLGCGNPVAVAALNKGEIVLDLGAGGGLDCFLAANKVGESGRVIGVDMTPEMIDKARENAEKGKYRNVEFRLGEIEYLPVADNSVDVVISNCVINLSTDKQQVLREAYRVLKPGGRIAISDLALLKELPEKIRMSMEAYAGCIGGALLLDDYKRIVVEAGFRDVTFAVKTAEDYSKAEAKIILDGTIQNLPDDAKSLPEYVASVQIEGFK